MEVLDRAFPPGECDDVIGEHYQRTGHYIVGGYCYNCYLNRQPPPPLLSYSIVDMLAEANVR